MKKMRGRRLSKGNGKWLKMVQERETVMEMEGGMCVAWERDRERRKEKETEQVREREGRNGAGRKRVRESLFHFSSLTKLIIS